MNNRGLLPLSDIFAGILPEWLVPKGKALHFVALDPSDSETVWTSSGFRMRHRLYVLQPIETDLLLIPGWKLRIGKPDQLMDFELEIATDPVPEVIIGSIDITIQASPSMLPAWKQVGQEWQPVLEERTGEEDRTGETNKPLGSSVSITTGIQGDWEGKIKLIDPSATIPYAFMIADTGLILQFDNSESTPPIKFVLNSGDIPPDLREKLGADFRGVLVPRLSFHYNGSESETRLPSLLLENGAIGKGGFSGSISWGLEEHRESTIENILDEAENAENGSSVRILGGSPDEPPLFYLVQIGGFKAVIHYLSIEITQSLPTASSLHGYVFVPWTESWMEFEISVGGPDGELMLQIGGVGDEALIDLENEWFEIKADSIEYFVKDGVHYAAVNGSIRPKFDGFDWPTFKVERLLVSSEGDIEIDGGWIDIPEAATLDFHGFKIDLSQIGFGNEEGTGGAREGGTIKRQWFGLSGAITLAEGIPLSASVEGLKFSWEKGSNDPSSVNVSLQGIEVKLEVPNVLKLHGKVAYHEVEDVEGQDQILEGHLFKGHVNLELYSLELEIGAELMVGKIKKKSVEEGGDGEQDEFTVFYIVVDANTPGIALASTGTAIFRLSGLFGMHAAPARGNQPWYEWYKSGEDDEEQYNITHSNKWGPKHDSYAFGAGLLVGTQFDDGTSLNVNAMVVILTPGPVVMIEGKANILKGKSDDPEEEGAFYALAVIDGRAGTFQLNIDAQYSLAKVIEIAGSIEAFFDFNDPTIWYVYLGQETPESKRIQATILSLFGAKTYFMIEHSGLLTGASAGYDLEKRLGPVELTLIARLAFQAGYSWKPMQLTGFIDLLGQLGLRVCGVGFDLILQLLLEGKAPTPYWVHGLARIVLKVLFSSIKLKIEFTWEKEKDPKPVEPFLKRAFMIHHKVNESSWELKGDQSDSIELPPQPLPEKVPVVPVDSRPVLLFARPLYGSSGTLSEDGERVDLFPRDRVDEWQFEYTCKRVELYEFREDESGNSSPISIKEYPLYDDIGKTPFDTTPTSLLSGTEAQEPKWQLWKQSAMDTVPAKSREIYSDFHPVCTVSVRAPMNCINWYGVSAGTEYEPIFNYKSLTFVAAPTSNPRVGDNMLRAHTPLMVNLPEPVRWLKVVLGPLLHLLGPYSTASIHLKLYRNGKFVGRVRGFPREYRSPHESTAFVADVFEVGDRTIDAFQVDSLVVTLSSPRPSSGITHEEIVIQPSMALPERDHRTLLDPAILASESASEFSESITGPSAASTTSLNGSAGGGSSELEEESTEHEEKRQYTWVNIIEICFKTEREMELEREFSDPSNISEYEAPVKKLELKPDHLYCLTVGNNTQVYRDGSGGADEPIDQRVQIEHYFFRTGLGPRSASTNGKIITGYEDMESKISTLADSPLNRLETYVARTIPSDGARQFYYSYDISLEFNEDYVEAMYRKTERLMIRVKDRNGRELGTAEGNWFDGLLPLMPAGLLTWLHNKDDRGCLDGDGKPARMSRHLRRKSPAELKPRRLYSAEVVLFEEGHDKGVLFEFPFTSSRYRNVQEHLTSGMDEEGHQVIRHLNTTATIESFAPVMNGEGGEGEPWMNKYDNYQDDITENREELSRYEDPIKEYQVLEIAELVKRASFSLKKLNDVCQEKFEQIYGSILQLDRMYRPLPRKVELCSFLIQESDKKVLLLESPEPIEWSRITWKSSIEDEEEVRIVWNEDRTRAFILRGNKGWFEAVKFQLTFTYRGDLMGLPLLTEYDEDSEISRYVNPLPITLIIST